MFSNSVELILSIAYREATARRHTHLTLEHLLYVLAHDAEGEKILNACGADLPALRSELNKYLSEKVEQFPHGRQQEPEQTLAFRRTLQTAVLHVQSASRPEVQAGDLLAAMLQQHKSFASQLLEGQGVTRLDILNFISHGIAKVPSPSAADRSSKDKDEGDAPSGQGEEGKASARDPLVAYTVNLSARAAAGELDPLIGRSEELQRTMEVLCRRRKNNPVFVGEAGVGKTALAEGLAQRLLQPDELCWVPHVGDEEQAAVQRPGLLTRATSFSSWSIRPWQRAVAPVSEGSSQRICSSRWKPMNWDFFVTGFCHRPSIWVSRSPNTSATGSISRAGGTAVNPRYSRACGWPIDLPDYGFPGVQRPPDRRRCAARALSPPGCRPG